MALTLLEASKRHGGDVVRQTIIELYAQSTDLMGAMQFRDINGNSYHYTQEQTLPGIAFRGVNEAYAESAGVVNPQTENLVIAGGDLDVDTFIIRTIGMQERSSREVMKIKALAQDISNTIIKGDSSANPKQFDGLQRRLSGNQVISNGGSSGGDPLSLEKLDETIDAVDGATHLLMSKAMRRKLTTASRDQSVGGHVDFDKDAFGRKVTVYNDLPILIADGNADVNATLAFNEAGTGGGTTATSIYALRIEEGYFSGIQNGDMEARDLGELDEKSVWRTRVEWFPGLVLEHPRAAARLRDISNAAAVS